MPRTKRETTERVKGRWIVTYDHFGRRDPGAPFHLWGFYANIPWFLLISFLGTNQNAGWAVQRAFPKIVELDNLPILGKNSFWLVLFWPTALGIVSLIFASAYCALFNLFFEKREVKRELVVDRERRMANEALQRQKESQERQARAEQQRWQQQEAERRKQRAIEAEKERQQQAIRDAQARERMHQEGRKAALRKIGLSGGRVDPREPLIFLYDAPFALVDSPFMEIQAAGLARANVASQATVGNDQTIYRSGDGPKSTTVIPAPIPYRGISFVGDRTKLTLNRKILVVQPYQMAWTQSGDMCSLVIGSGGDVLYAYNHVRHEEEYRCSEIERIAVDKLKPELMALFRKYMEGGSSSLPGSDGYA